MPSHVICVKSDKTGIYSFMIKFCAKMAQININPPISRIKVKFPGLCSLIKKSTYRT